MERESGFQERDWMRIKEGQERIQRSLDATLDRGLFRWAMARAAALPAEQRIAPLDTLAGLKPGMTKDESAKRRLMPTLTLVCLIPRWATSPSA